MNGFVASTEKRPPQLLVKILNFTYFSILLVAKELVFRDNREQVRFIFFRINKWLSVFLKNKNLVFTRMRL